MPFAQPNPALEKYLLDNPDITYEEAVIGLASRGVQVTYDTVRSKASRMRAAGHVVCTKSPPISRKKASSVKGVDKKTVVTFEDAKAKLLSKQADRYEREDTVAEERFQLVLDTVHNAIKPLEFVAGELQPPAAMHSDVCEEEVACLLLSDTHFGKKTRFYNIPVALERVEYVFTKFMGLIDYHRRSGIPVNKAVVFLTGDLVDGALIYPSQGAHLDTHVVNQIFKTAPHMVEQFTRLAAHVAEIEVYAVPGNHGRTHKMNHEHANWDTVYVEVLRGVTANIPNLKWFVEYGWNQTADIAGVKILQYHGHQIKMTLNLPWYGVTTRLSRWGSSKALHDFDIAVQGHFHTSSRLQWNNVKVFLNGTTVAGDEFALEHLGLESSESQWVFFVHPKHRVTAQYEVNVASIGREAVE